MKDDIYFKEQFENHKKQNDLADKLRNGTVDIYELQDDEVSEMIDYFVKDSQAIDMELERIKAHILLMRKKLNNI